ncbi:fructosamine kinase family protein [Leptolyngbya sp. FACHB-541]|uniref:fructosamine kinase family protein n=1 Tax=Leptolyngbya sp. FACHB-541 TaxID=2692810 RepID=UPI00168898EE|nr:fructosamine kinase family protein [Leptolyngbya sp. FACHB-541]MBD2000807.1 fructosamine kinase family protein [Leptolyngbya sp. FACHB-541]
MWNRIAEQISQTIGKTFQEPQRRPVGGGSVNQAYALTSGSQSYFVKINQATRIAMFEAEALGLKQIASTKTIRVPKPICWGTVDSSAYIVLEWLDLGYGTHRAWEEMGRNLAAMHRVSSDRGFGWEQQNTIGFMPQVNPWTTDWTEFFAQQRIGYQFQLAQRRGGNFPNKERLLVAIPELLEGHNPQSSLVHGDLWSGNAAVTQLEEPVILDPATYFGDREVDLAMTELFGSFPNEFYRAYDKAFPLEPGYERRKTLYNLYHILNHFNQFGGSYEGQANRMIASLLG